MRWVINEETKAYEIDDAGIQRETIIDMIDMQVPNWQNEVIKIVNMELQLKNKPLMEPSEIEWFFKQTNNDIEKRSEEKK